VSKRIRISNFFLSVVFVGIITLTFDTRAETSAQQAIEAKLASCPVLPNVVWWRTTRIKIVNYVDLKYRGDWVPYIQKWEAYKQKMTGILANNGTALVKSRNIRLHGDKLAAHIQEIERRLEVTQCLKRKFSGQLAYNNNFIPIPLKAIPNNMNAYKEPNRAILISEDLNPTILETIGINVVGKCDEAGLSEKEKMFAEMCLK
jgi:hypothetical protein